MCVCVCVCVRVYVCVYVCVCVCVCVCIQRHVSCSGMFEFLCYIGKEGTMYMYFFSARFQFSILYSGSLKCPLQYNSFV